ncbi:MAG: phosphoenolpyruvate-protein phosphotransferase system enzyme [Fusobacteriaceae bacterium]|jgi:phosphotransferase system enzyme I (PtsI)|nr:phosphoenolpyruvate-protein phosphotransferase system enzyme [Fusobacteriaceae bacterium]
MEKIFKGIDASPGIALGKVFLYEEVELDIKEISNLSSEEEKKRLLEGRDKTKAQLEAIREKARIKMGDDKAAIFDGHITLLEDEELFDEVVEKIEDEGYTAEYALNEGIEEYCAMISALEDEYLRERAADLADIGKRWIKNVLGVEILDLSNLPKNSIIVAKDITPSDTAQMDLENVGAFITEIGGKTAHSAIMARTLEIPAVVGVVGITDKILNGTEIIVDANTGDIIINPTEENKDKYSKLREEFLKEKEELKKLKDKEAITTDNHKVNLWANIGSPKDLTGVLANGAEGIGLYRTEFLFMNSDKLPTEDEQFAAYKEVAEKMEGKPVTIRTMDIGGDKELPYLKLPKEMNPFLGYRALRVCLKEKDMFKTQLRALLRASKYGQIKIMLPMVISLDEVREAKKLLEECKEELRKEKVEFDEDIKVGIMVETPAVAFRAKYFAKEVDFFSIGTNDLTQYTLAVDRGNEIISELYDTYNPAVLEAIRATIEGAHAEGITVSMCGEFAGDNKATKLLLGLGLDAFSMSATSIPRVKKVILESNYENAKQYADKLLEMDTAKDIKSNL